MKQKIEVGEYLVELLMKEKLSILLLIGSVEKKLV
jgi:hypothetical protein